MVKLKTERMPLIFLASFILIQALAVIFRGEKPLIWDSAVYTGMGKFIFSAGKIGFWEYFRPPMIPTIIGVIWKTGLFSIEIARVFAITIAAAGSYLIYEMVSKEYNKTIGLYTLAILISSSIFLYWSHRLLTGIPASFLVFASIYYANNNKPIYSGIIAASAFFTRFPSGLVIIPASLAIILSEYRINESKNGLIDKIKLKTTLKSLTKLGTAYTIPLIIYFSLNEFLGKGFLAPIIKGATVPTGNPDKYLLGSYFIIEAIKSNPITIFSALGIFYTLKNVDKKSLSYLTGLIIFYSFFTLYPHKEPRFILLFMPLIAFFSAKGLYELKIPKNSHIDTIKSKVPEFNYKTILVILVSAIMMLTSGIHIHNVNNWENQQRQNYMSNISELEGTIGGLNPAIMSYTDSRFLVLRPELFEQDFDRIFRKSDYFALDTCSWYCTPAIDNCKQKKNRLIQELDNQHKNLFDQSINQCRYAIYELN